jgi:hypothetical protein
MGLFDPPIVAIRQRIPDTHLDRLDGLIRQLREVMPAFLTPTEAGLIEGYVAAVWVGHGIQTGRLSIDDRQYLYIMNSGANCLRFLKDTSVLAAQLALVVMPELGDEE